LLLEEDERRRDREVSGEVELLPVDLLEVGAGTDERLDDELDSAVVLAGQPVAEGVQPAAVERAEFGEGGSVALQ
jgi:hypothetical protein